MKLGHSDSFSVMFHQEPMSRRRSLVPSQSKLRQINWIQHYIIGIENGQVTLHTGKFLIIRNVRECLNSFGEEYASLSPCAAISLHAIP